MTQQMVRVEPTTMGGTMDTMTVAKMLAESGFFGDVRQAGQALAKILAGQELGMGPIASLMGVYFAQGKVTYSANIMAAAVKKSGHYDYDVQHLGDDGCAIEFLRRDGPGWRPMGVSEFTREDAKRGGLLDGPNKHNWTKWPRNMFFARAMSNGCKWYTPDIFGGVTPYTPDELGAEVKVADDGSVTVVDVTPEPTPLRTLPNPRAAEIEPTEQEMARAREAVGVQVGAQAATGRPKKTREQLVADAKRGQAAVLAKHPHLERIPDEVLDEAEPTALREYVRGFVGLLDGSIPVPDPPTGEPETFAEVMAAESADDDSEAF